MSENAFQAPAPGFAGRTAWRTAGVVLTVVAILATCLSLVGWMVRQTETVTHVYSGQVSELNITANSGDVSIEPSSDSSVHVRRHVVWSYQKPDVVEELRGGTLRIEPNCHAGFPTSFGDCHVDFTVELPADVAINATAHSGNIAISGMTGDVRAEIHSGDLLVRNLTGSLDAKVRSGDLEGIGLRTARVNAENRSGDIVLTFAEPPDQVTADNRSGDISIGVPGPEMYDIRTDVRSGDSVIGVNVDTDVDRAISVTDRSGDIAIFYLDE